VESVALSGWPLMSGNGWSSDVRLPNRPPEELAPYFLSVSPQWLETMGIAMIGGRDFRAGERPPRQENDALVDGPVIVNEAFAKKYFDGESPIGKSFHTGVGKENLLVRNVIIGHVRDARYRNMREPIRPTVYVPFDKRNWGTFIVRTTAADPSSLALPLRRAVAETRPEFRVSNTVLQTELVRNHTIRERLLATLSLFFAGVALILAAVGLYGVLNYAVVQRRREIGIRMALGARAGHVAREVSSDVFLMLVFGSAVGLGAGLASERFVETHLYEVKGTDLRVLATPLATLFATALLAALPPVILATRTDPATALRSE
jgi:hypothetical protein